MIFRILLSFITMNSLFSFPGYASKTDENEIQLEEKKIVRREDAKDLKSFLQFIGLSPQNATDAEVDIDNINQKISPYNTKKMKNNPTKRKELYLEILEDKNKGSIENIQGIILDYLTQQDCINQLYLKGFTLLSDNFLEKMRLDHLKILNIENCKQIGHKILEILASKALSLEILEMGIFSSKIGPFVFKNLKELTLSHCPNLIEIQLNVPHLISLKLKRCELLTDEALDKLIHETPHLQKLFLSECKLISIDNEFRYRYPSYPLSLVKDKNVQVWLTRLMSSNNDEVDLKNIQEMFEKGRPVLDTNILGMKVFERALSLSPKITSLNLDNIQFASKDSALKIFSHNQTIRSLSLANNGLSTKAAIYLAENTAITSLNLAKNFLGDEGTEKIIKNDTFTFLNLESNLITDVGIKNIVNNTKLIELILANNQVKDEGAFFLTENKSLTKLNLANNFVGDKGAAAFLTITNYKILNLRSNGISKSICAALSKAYSQNKDFYIEIDQKHKKVFGEKSIKGNQITGKRKNNGNIKELLQPLNYNYKDLKTIEEIQNQ